MSRHRHHFLAAVVTVALAVGANLSIFTIVNAIWLRPQPIEAPERVVMVSSLTEGASEPSSTTLDAPAWSVFETVAGQLITSDIGRELLPRLSLLRNSRNLETLAVTPRYFPLLGIQVRGRDFSTHDDVWGAEPVAIISDALWASLFDRAPSAIGSLLETDPVPVRVIGVAARGFRGARLGERIDVWIPVRLAPRLSVTRAHLSTEPLLQLLVMGRMRPGDSIPDALTRIKQIRNSTRDADLALVPIGRTFGTLHTRTVVIRESASITVVAALAFVVLVGGCLTLAAMLLVHYERRQSEFVIRTILGEPRQSLIASLAVELSAIAAAGLAGATLVAALIVKGLPAVRLPGGIILSTLDLSIDVRVVGAGLALTVVTMACAALSPVLRFTASSSRLRLHDTATAPQNSQRLRRLLLGAHVAGTVVVLSTAGLFTRSVLEHLGPGAGFQPQHTVFVRTSLMSMYANLPSSGDWNPWWDRAREQMLLVRDALRRESSVQDVAFGMAPLGPEAQALLQPPRSIDVDGHRHSVRLGIMAADPHLLQVLGVPLLSGRALSESDAVGRPLPAVITSSVATTLFPDGKALGRIIRLGSRWGNAVIVGVSQDVLFGSAAAPAAGVLFMARAPGAGADAEFVVRTPRPDLAVADIRRAISAVLPDSPGIDVVTGRALVARDIESQTLGAWFFSGFGLISGSMALVSVFALVAFLAESRRKEFGIRMALGASAANLRWHGVSFAAGPVAVGIGAGMAAAMLVTSAFASAFPGVDTSFDATYVFVPLAMLTVALATAAVACRRLRTLRPMDALLPDRARTT